MDHHPPDSSVYRILQARILKWVAIPSSREIFLTEESNLSLLCLPALEGRFFTTSATWEAQGPLILTKNYIREAFLFPASVPPSHPSPQASKQLAILLVRQVVYSTELDWTGSCIHFLQ